MIPIDQKLIDPYTILKLLLTHYNFLPIRVFTGNGVRSFLIIEKVNKKYIVDPNYASSIDQGILTVSLEELLELIKKRNDYVLTGIMYSGEWLYLCEDDDCFTQKKYKSANMIKRQWKARNFREKANSGFLKKRAIGQIDYAPPGQFNKNFPGGKEYHRFMKEMMNENYSSLKNESYSSLKNDIAFLKK